MNMVKIRYAVLYNRTIDLIRQNTNEQNAKNLQRRIIHFLKTVHINRENK